MLNGNNWNMYSVEGLANHLLLAFTPFLPENSTECLNSTKCDRHMFEVKKRHFYILQSHIISLEDGN